MIMEVEHWINGKSVAPSSKVTTPSLNPSNGEVVAHVAYGDRLDVSLAVEAAHKGFPEWARRKPIERGRVLSEIAKLIRRDEARLSSMEAAETGRAPTSPQGIEGAAGYFEFYGGMVNALHGETLDIGPGRHCYTLREAFGVVGVITPWNGPLNQAARAIAPALAAGNTVVVKPSEFTSSTTVALAALATEAGLPHGVLNVVTGTGEDVGRAIVEHPLVRKVAFTGSVRAGQAIGHIAAERLIPLTLELGGKSANIIFEDADLQKAVPGSLMAFTRNAGQYCGAGTRLLVHESLHDEFVGSLSAAAELIQLGSEMGPMMTEAQFEKVKYYFDIAKDEKLVAATGGVVPEASGQTNGYFVPPTIFTGATNDSRLAREEVFGPVLTVIPFRDEEEAIQVANDSEFGLAAGLWTRDVSRALRVAAALEAGSVWVNGWMAGEIEPPFGGYKRSGYGREKGMEALHHYTQLKCVTISYDC